MPLLGGIFLSVLKKDKVDFCLTSKNNDELTLLTNKPWVLIDKNSNIKTIYVFRGNEDLLISTNG